jgi:hypothetical protein
MTVMSVGAVVVLSACQSHAQGEGPWEMKFSVLSSQPLSDFLTRLTKTQTAKKAAPDETKGILRTRTESPYKAAATQ